VLPLVLVCLGGALGSGARYGVSTWAARALGSFSQGTLLVNVSGSFLLALLMGVAATRGLSPEARLFLGGGILGGYTTYSSFNYEALVLADGGSPARAVGYVALTVVGCLVAGLAGLVAGRALAG
jgi:CrcB protein